MDTKSSEILLSIEYDLSITNADGVRCVCMKIMNKTDYEKIIKLLKENPDQYYDDGGSFSRRYEDLKIVADLDRKKIKAFKTLFGTSFVTSYTDIFENLLYKANENK